MNTMDVFDIVTKPRGVMDLVLKENARHLVSNEAGRLDLVILLHEEVLVERPALNG